MELKVWNVSANAPGPEGKPVPVTMEVRGPLPDSESAVAHVAKLFPHLADVKAEEASAPAPNRRVEEVK